MWAQPDWWRTEDHREAGQTTRERRDQLDELGDLQGTLRRGARNIGVCCPSLENLQRKDSISNWLLLIG